MSRLWIGVDVGNTRIKCWKLAEPAEAPFQHRIASGHWPEPLLTWRNRLTETGSEKPSVGWLIASVQRAACERLTQWLSDHVPRDLVRIVTSEDVPLATSLPQRTLVGVDRLLASWAAWLRTAGPVVVADAGSALTIDWTDRQGTFRGGAILPGIELQLRALGEHTCGLADAVQRIRASTISPEPTRLSYPGEDTAAAILTGVYTNLVVTIESIVAEVEQRSGQPVQLILSGGDAHQLSPLLSRHHTLVPDLVRQALAQLSTGS